MDRTYYDKLFAVHEATDSHQYQYFGQEKIRDIPSLNQGYAPSADRKVCRCGQVWITNPSGTRWQYSHKGLDGLDARLVTYVRRHPQHDE